MRSRDERSSRVVEIELDLPRLAFGAALLVVAVLTAFFIGRAVGRSGGNGSPRLAATSAAAVPGEGPVVEDVAGGQGLFDRVGEGGSTRERGRQVTEEAAAARGVELDLGAFRSREEAERVKGLASRMGWRSVVAGDVGGGYRVAAGPFESREEARRAARELEAALGRPVAVGEERR